MKCFVFLLAAVSVICVVSAEPVRYGGRYFRLYPRRQQYFARRSSDAGIYDEPIAQQEQPAFYPDQYPIGPGEIYLPPSNDQPAQLPQNEEPSVPQLDEESDGSDDVPPFTKAGGQYENGGSGNTFFPITFGRTNGGSIGIANSFSTGTKGSSSSYAVSYGNPATSN